MQRTKEQGPTRICVCGNPKENIEKRYCDDCGIIHGRTMHRSHAGKGQGRRRRLFKKVLAPSG